MTERRILLAVTGLSPQVVTETLYALCVAQTSPWIPDEVRLITTREGAERARLLLLSEQIGWFRRFCCDYRMEGIRFDESHIHILATPDGRELDDIRSPEENLLGADFITEQVRALTALPEAALHVSIAGGRKTMGFFLGYALSLFGREQDRLSHVLVSAPFENNWNFFYPTPYEHILETHDNKPIDARDAKISLADIPFVSLRHGLPSDLLEGRARYVETVAAARTGLGPLTLVIDIARKTVETAGRVIALPPAELALLALFVRRAVERKDALCVPIKDEGDEELAAQYLAELRRIKPDADPDDLGKRFRKGMDGDTFSEYLSKLRKHLGPLLARRLFDDGGTRPKRYRITVAPENVRFV